MQVEASRLLERAKKYDKPISSILGAPGIKECLVQKAQKDSAAQVEALQAEISRLRRKVKQLSTFERERDTSQIAFSSLLKAQSLPAEVFPLLKTRHCPPTGRSKSACWYFQQTLPASIAQPFKPLGPVPWAFNL